MTGYHNDYLGWWKEYGLSSPITVLYKNIKDSFIDIAYLVSVGPFQFIQKIFTNNTIMIYGFLGFTLWLSLFVYWKRKNSLVFIVFSQFVLFIIWPWPPDRFLIPIIPLIYFSFFQMIHLLLKRFSTSTKRILKVLSILIMLGVLVTNGTLVKENIIINSETKYTAFNISPMPPHWNSFKEQFNWIKKNTKINDLIMAPYDSMIYLFTGRSCVRSYFLNPLVAFYDLKGDKLGSVGNFITNIEKLRPKYFIVSAMPGYSEYPDIIKFINKSMILRPELFELEYVGDDTRFTIFKLNY